MTTKLFRFPAPFVYVEELEEHNNIKKKLIEGINDDLEMNEDDYRMKMGGDWDCDVLSSFMRDTPLQFMTPKLYDTIVWQPLVRCLNILMQDSALSAPKNPQLSEFWYNKYVPGQYQEIHHHMAPGENGSAYSGIYLLKMDPREINPTTFYYNNTPAHYEGGKQIQYRTGDYREGSVIIFPSDLQHYVKPAKHNRITISFNIISEA